MICAYEGSTSQLQPMARIRTGYCDHKEPPNGDTGQSSAVRQFLREANLMAVTAASVTVLF